MRFLSPQKIIDRMHVQYGFKSDHVILDMGAGSGSFTFPLLKRAGKDNKLIAVDIDHELLRKIKDNAIIGGYNLETVIANLENDLLFQDNYADYIFLANILHQIDNKDGLIREVARVLKPGGQMVLIDWHADSQFGPHPASRVDLDNLVPIIRNYFIIKDELDAGAYHFGYTLKKK